MDSFGLVEGAIYNRRKDIHGRFGGSLQSGISPAPQSGVVLIFTGDEGGRYGYTDHWDAQHQTFTYTGHGQEGNMEFLRGNRAIRDHVQDGKALLLFEKVDRSGLYRYMGEMQCAGVTEGRGPDANGNDRRVIQFQLVRLQAISTEQIAPAAATAPDDVPREGLLRNRAYAAARPRSESAATASRNLYHRSKIVAEYALTRADGICECCGQPAPFARSDGSPYLEVHHIERLSDGGLDAPDHVAAVCPTCHRRAHHGADRAEVNGMLRVRIRHLEASFGASVNTEELA